MGSGVGLGIVFSVVLFKSMYIYATARSSMSKEYITIHVNIFWWWWWSKGRPWPVIFGTGVGLGMAFANCQHDFRQPFLAPGPGSTIKITDPQLIETILKVYTSFCFVSYLNNINIYNLIWLSFISVEESRQELKRTQRLAVASKHLIDRFYILRPQHIFHSHTAYTQTLDNFERN